jgi:hypothetical protein
MEKNIKTSNLDIVIKNEEGVSTFEIKAPKHIQRALMNELKQDFSIVSKGAIVVYPEQKIIDSQRVYIETSSIYL